MTRTHGGELKNGKEKFPGMNTVRIWLSWNAYCRLQEKFITHIRRVIAICAELDLYVVPCLFNRWHDPMVDCDGIFIDHFLPGSSWLHKFGNLFEDYIDELCLAFGKEERILVWDICNEPLAYDDDFPMRDEIQKHELAWLHKMADRIRKNGTSQPLGIGSVGSEPMETFGDICDVYLTHLYYIDNPEKFRKKVARFAEEAKRNDKPLITSECCWGSLDDKKREELIRTALSIFKEFGIGFIAHALQYSGCTDLHDPCDGRVTPSIGNLCFINKDLSLRPYHDAFNDY